MKSENWSLTFDGKDSQILNPKHEIPAFAEAASRRQAKFETNTNVQRFETQNDSLSVPRSAGLFFSLFETFGFGSFEFVSDFDIRISSLYPKISNIFG